jgi:DNA-binding transcriptional MerR regulator
MRAGLTIGDFATLTQLSVRTLRRYHEAGLLEPAAVDPATGYRYYAAEQIPRAQVIHRLRELDVPLAEVEAILATDDAERRTELIAGHLQRLENELDHTRSAVVSLRRLLHPDGRALQVALRSVPARTVAAISAEVDSADIHAWYERHVRERAVHRRRRDHDSLPDGARPPTVRPHQGPRPATGRTRRGDAHRTPRRHRRHLRPPRRVGRPPRSRGRRPDP